MPHTRIKICGLRNAATAAAAVAAGADALGFIFVHGSPRHVPVNVAADIARTLPPFVEPVGVFVDAPVSEVTSVAAAVGLRTVQLHGDETPAYAAELVNLRVIKALTFTGPAAAHIAPWRHAPPNVAAILWDTPTPGSGSSNQQSAISNQPTSPAPHQRGGQGEPFDWQHLAAMQKRGELTDLPPMILAGGLTVTNVTDAVRLLRPYAVDVSSGVESTKGVKDVRLIADFIQAVHLADKDA